MAGPRRRVELTHSTRGDGEDSTQAIGHDNKSAVPSRWVGGARPFERERLAFISFFCSDLVSSPLFLRALLTLMPRPPGQHRDALSSSITTRGRRRGCDQARSSRSRPRQGPLRRCRKRFPPRSTDLLDRSVDHGSGGDRRRRRLLGWTFRGWTSF